MSASESGITALRLNFIRETTIGTTPTNPAWLRYSDEFDSFGWSPNATIVARRSAGDPDVVGFSKGVEEHDFTITYSLQRWLNASTKDAAYDGLIRGANGGYRDTHSVMIRQSLLASAGLDSGGSRIYTYAQGAYIDRVSIVGNPSDSEPVKVEVAYKAKKVRSIRIDQPSTGSTLTVESTSASDTTQSVTMEDDGASTSEAETLNGTTAVATAATFSTLDAVRLSAETVGDVIVRGPASVELCRIQGKTSNGGATSDGDLGLPLLGSGSFESALGTALEHVIDDTVTKGGGVFEITGESLMTIAIEAQNGIDVTPVVGSRQQAISVGDRSVSMSAAIFSESGSHDAFVDHLKANTNNIVWTFAGGTVTLTSAALTGVGGRTHSKGDAVMRRDNTFTGQDLTLT